MRSVWVETVVNTHQQFEKSKLCHVSPASSQTAWEPLGRESLRRVWGRGCGFKRPPRGSQVASPRDKRSTCLELGRLASTSPFTCSSSLMLHCPSAELRKIRRCNAWTSLALNRSLTKRYTFENNNPSPPPRFPLSTSFTTGKEKS